MIRPMLAGEFSMRFFVSRRCFCIVLWSAIFICKYKACYDYQLKFGEKPCGRYLSPLGLI